MKTKISPTVIGLFVLGAILLAVVALFSFGGVNFFNKPERFVVYFDESIHGLDNGSPVKFRGVRIGRVTGMSVRAIPPTSGAEGARSVVAVVCELSRDVVSDAQGRSVDVSDRGELQKLVDEGLRAQLGVVGYATGLLYVELDFYDPAKNPGLRRADIDTDYLEVPSLPSKGAEIMRNFNEVVGDIKRIDFPKLAAEAEGLLVDTRRQINAIDVAGISREWTEAGRAVRELAGGPETKAIIADVSSVLKRLDGTMAELEKAVGPGAKELDATLKDARAAIADFGEMAVMLKRFVAAQQNLGDDASKALRRLAEAADAVGRLADFLERNPNALLSGRAEP